jgi:3-hydroxyacyl-CoA dehydrogenase
VIRSGLKGSAMGLENIKRVGVVGSGLMGHGIALAFALGGYPTIMSDLGENALKEGMRKAKALSHRIRQRRPFSESRPLQSWSSWR